MERLTQTSNKGGVAFTFDLDITCKPSEAQKILRLAEKLKFYEDLEEQGLLLRLPCKVGDSVFKIIDECDFPDDCHTRCMCKGCDYRNLYIEEEIVSFNGEVVLMIDYFGETVFLTREEAEQALTEMKEV